MLIYILANIVGTEEIDVMKGTVPRKRVCDYDLGCCSGIN
jgi:hypothetical protein